MANINKVVVDGVTYDIGGTSDAPVTSVNGKTGAVSLTPADIGAKATQTAKSSPTASGTAVEFISDISQDAQGVITATKKSVPEATVTNAGLMTTRQVGRLTYIDDGLLTASDNFAPEALGNSTYPIRAGSLFIRYNGWSTTTDMAGWHLCRALVDIASYSETRIDDKGITYEDIKVSDLFKEVRDSILAAYPTAAASGSIATIPDGAEGLPVKAMTVDIDTETGVTGATITRCGRNMLDVSTATTGTNNGITYTVGKNADGAVTGIQISGTASDLSMRPFFAVSANYRLPPGDYVLSKCTDDYHDYQIYVNCYNGSTYVKQFIAGNSVRQRAFTLDYEGYDRITVGAAVSSGKTVDVTCYPAIFPAGAVQEFEPYTAQTYSVDWSDGPGAITEGVLDAVAGKLTTGGQTYDVTPVAVETLLGANTIFADCGDVSVTYRADPTLYASRGQTEDDMTADAPIASGKYFQIGNTLYRATAAIATGETIVPGTNCAVTNLAEALNLLNA